MSDGWHPVYSVKIALLQGGMHMLLKSVCLPVPGLWLKFQHSTKINTCTNVGGRLMKHEPGRIYIHTMKIEPSKISHYTASTQLLISMSIHDQSKNTWQPRSWAKGIKWSTCQQRAIGTMHDTNSVTALHKMVIMHTTLAKVLLHQWVVFFTLEASHHG